MKVIYQDLLFMIFGVQLGYFNPGDVERFESQHEKNPSGTLTEVASDDELLSDKQSQLLTTIVEKTIEMYGGNPRQAWEALQEINNLPISLQETTISPVDVEDTPIHKIIMRNEWDVSAGAELPGRYTYGPGRSPSIDEAREVGRGGMGRVFVAFDEHLGRTIAVKQLLPSFSTQRKFHTPRTSAAIARFLREARVTGQLEHPGIVPVYELGKREDGSLYYTMKLMRGRTLEQALEDCHSLPDRLRLLRHFDDLCQAVAYAHSRGVINRDIKPENVMLGEFGETVVLDWGTAKILDIPDVHNSEPVREIELIQDAEPLNTMDGLVIGTPYYMSPEQALGKIDIVDARSDVWSLGAVLYRILTGEMPFQGVTAREVIRNVTNGAYKPVLKVCPQAPADLAVVAEKALKVEKAQRYETAADLAKEVEAFESGARIGAYAYSSWELVKRFVTRNKGPSILAAVLTLVLLVGSGVILSAYHQAENARQLALTSEKEANFNYSLSLLEKGETAYQEGKFSRAGIFAAASLLHNPYNPYGPYKYADDRLMQTPEAAINVADSHSLLFQAQTHQFIYLAHTLHGQGVLRSARFSPDGKLVAAAGESGKAFVFSVTDGKKVAQFENEYVNKRALAFSPDGKIMALGGGGPVSLWNLKTMEQIGVIKGDSRSMSALRFSPDGRYLASSGSGAGVQLWSTDDFSLVDVFSGHKEAVISICFSPNSRLMATGGMDNEIRLWNLSERKLIATLKGHKDRVSDIEFSPSGESIASASFDKTVKLWSVERQCLVATLNGHEHTVHALSFSPDGSHLATTGWDRNIRVWDVAERKTITLFRAHSEPVMSVVYSPDGKWLASAGDNGNIRLWRVDNEKPKSILRGHGDYVRSVNFSDDGRFLASASMDRTIRLWSVPDRRLLSILKGHEDHVYSADFSPDNSLLVSSGLDCTIRIWSLEDNCEPTVLQGHKSIVMCVAFSPDGSLIASAGHDHAVGLWSVAERKLITFLTGHKDYVRTVSFSPDGSLLASASYDHTIRLWDVKKRSLLKVLKGHNDWAPGVGFSPDGKTLVTASKDRSIKLWDVVSGECIRTFNSLNQSLNHICFSPDGKLLLASGGDRSAYVLDSQNGHVLQRIKTDFMVFDATFSHDGTKIALDNNKVVEIYPVDLTSWHKDPAEILLHAQNNAGMKLDKITLGAWQGAHKEQ